MRTASLAGALIFVFVGTGSAPSASSLAVSQLKVPGIPLPPQDPNFTQGVWFSASALSDATATEWAPDGRLFVTLKGGTVRVIGGSPLAMTTWYSFPSVYTQSECGLLGIAFDPNFTQNGFAYFFITVSSSEQRIYRLTDSGGVGTALTLIRGGLPCAGQNHDGGALAVGPDGKLYWGIGDLGNYTGVGGDLDSYAAKVCRANLDGTAPTDNPWYDASDGISARDYVWARGFRNPFTMAFHPTTGGLWLDVVGSGYEQIFLVGAGDHGGWHLYEGGNQPAGSTPPGGGQYIDPKLSYATNDSDFGGCVTGGVFYTGTAFPSSYSGNLFWGDYNSGNIMRSQMDPSGNNIQSTSVFVTGVYQCVDVTLGPDGALYYKGRSNGDIYRLAYTGAGAVNLVLSTNSLSVGEGSSDTFAVSLSAPPPGGSLTVAVAPTSGSTDVDATPPTLSFTSSNWSTPQTVTVAADEDADTVSESATITCSASGLTSQDVVVTVIDDDSPLTATIVNPVHGQTVSGSTAEFYGTGAPGIVQAQFYIDGALAYTDVSDEGHYHLGGAHGQWDTTSLSNGPHTLRMTVSDGNGLTASHEITVFVDNSGGSGEAQGGGDGDGGGGCAVGSTRSGSPLGLLLLGLLALLPFLRWTGRQCQPASDVY